MYVCRVHPVHLAIEYHKPDFLKLFIDAGANVNAYMGGSRDYLIHTAIDNGSSKCLELLIKAGADVNQMRMKITPVHDAIVGNQVECFRVLLQNGADVNIKGQFGGNH